MIAAFVKIWGELAGAVAWDEKTGIATFEYTADFKKKNWDVSPLKMPIQSAKTIFNFPELKHHLIHSKDCRDCWQMYCLIDTVINSSMGGLHKTAVWPTA
jgi:hypothetical protein